ncbi:14925_t:CDS:2 [Cetraspora pellucida]|uniref:14925_t:CDS:1 n=1 Tax=Cetraspora pellucida TaxID=1433469 RepID=A0A9N9BID8_9GLOM|nr:14925_t:CDS:2 [Cetraspora pellucida]
MSHNSKRQQQINNLSRKRGHFAAQEVETHEITVMQDKFTLRTSPNNTLLNAKALSNTLFNDKTLAPSNILIGAKTSASSNILLDVEALILSNILLDVEVSRSNNISLLQLSTILQNSLLAINITTILCICLEKQQSPESCSSKAVNMYIEEALLPKIPKILFQKKCPNVVAYRKRWLKRMFKYKIYIKDFVDNMLKIVIKPELESDKRKLVQVIHDESFMYQCHGLLQLSEEQFWINSHIKYKEAYVLHSVQANTENALVTMRINKGPRDTKHKMCNKKPKGIQQVLEKHNLWPVKDVNLVCDQCSKKGDDDFEELNCCAQ